MPIPEETKRFFGKYLSYMLTSVLIKLERDLILAYLLQVKSYFIVGRLKNWLVISADNVS